MYQVTQQTTTLLGGRVAHGEGRYDGKNFLMPYNKMPPSII